MSSFFSVLDEERSAFHIFQVFSRGAMITRFVANLEKCRKYVILGGYAQIITIIGGGASQFIAVSYGVWGDVSLHPKYVLRYNWTAPNNWSCFCCH